MNTKSSKKIISKEQKMEAVEMSTEIIDDNFSGHELFAELFEFMFDLSGILELNGKFVKLNRTWNSVFGYTKYDLQNKKYFDFIHPDEVSFSRDKFKLLKKDGAVIKLKNRYQCANGSYRFIEWYGKSQNKRIYLIAKDITEEKHPILGDHFYKLFNNNPVAMAVSNLKNNEIIEINFALLELLGYSANEIVGKKVEELNFFVDKNEKQKIKLLLKNNLHIENLEMRIRKKDGRILNCLFSGDIIDNQIEKVLLIVMIDITERKRKEEKIEFLSFHDQLTCIYNRRFYEEELKRLDVERKLPLTLIMSDVNGLKIVNDSFGHTVGDALLQQAANVIRDCCRTDDIVARIGGDEFVIILTNTGEKEAEEIIQRIKNVLSQTKIGALDVSVSFGSATKMIQQQEIQDIFKSAEDHMYQNKLLEKFSLRSKILDIIMNALYEKIPSEKMHSERVQDICEQIARHLDFSKDDINQIRLAGKLHDIGKIAIDDMIQTSTRQMNDLEWVQIKQHPEIGYRILSSINEFSEIAVFVHEHHERWDGTGYPKGLKETEIALPSRIIAVAEAYDTMTSYKSYGITRSMEEAVEELKKCAGTQFDPEIVAIFISEVLFVPTIDS